MASKENPKWVKDDRGIDCVKFHGACWYVDFYGSGISVVFDKDVRVDLLTANTDMAVVEEFVKEHPSPAA